MNANDIAWGSAFHDLNIPSRVVADGFADVTANDIRVYREPRLMAKFDTDQSLPKPFQDHGLAILPISRGKYRIGAFRLYEKMPKVSWANRSSITRLELPGHLHSFDSSLMKSEAVAINAAYACRALQSFLDEDEIFPTLAGRLGTGNFSFNVSTKSGRLVDIPVKSAQMEIDGCYEGLKTIGLIEAKSKFSQDFLIRQLYFPYRFATTREFIKKPVRPIFQVFSNNTFYFFEYAFSDYNNYNSLYLVKQAQYRLQDRILTMSDLSDILDENEESITNLSPDKYKAPSFPQADSFERLVNLCEFIAETGGKETSEITNYFRFDKRQSNYYTAALRYLHLGKRVKRAKKFTYVLTDETSKALQSGFADRQLYYARRMLSHPVLKEAFSTFLECGNYPDKAYAVMLMRKHGVDVTEGTTTETRRAQTIIAWIKWLHSLSI